MIAAAVLVLLATNPTAGRISECLEPGTLDARTWEQDCWGGLEAGLNARGHAAQLDFDTGIALGRAGDPVEFFRYGLKVLILPRPFQAASSALWGLTIGVRGGFYLLKADLSASGEGNPSVRAESSNYELPSLGFVAHTPLDRFRFELDAAPVIGGWQASGLVAEAALVAALASSPRDDILFLPNLKNGGRVRAMVRARFDPWNHLSFAVSVAGTLGFAELGTRVGTITGTTGGADVGFEVMVPTGWHFLEGVSLRAGIDLGAASVWPTDVVFPVRTSLGLGFSFCRWLEIAFTGALVSQSAVVSFSQYSTLGLTVRMSYESASPEEVKAWTMVRRQTERSAPPTLVP